MQYGKDFYTLSYTTEWRDCDNTVISLYENGNDVQMGIVEVRVFKTDDHKGEACIWNLHVREGHRGKGYGRALLGDAITAAMIAGCKAVSLEWDLRDSPRWVLEWYVREGFDEREFGKGCALMVKDIA